MDWLLLMQEITRSPTKPTEARFKAIFGVEINVMNEIVKYIPSHQFNPTHVLYYFFFIKCYPNSGLAAVFLNTSEATFLRVVFSINELLYLVLPKPKWESRLVAVHDEKFRYALTAIDTTDVIIETPSRLYLL